MSQIDNCTKLIDASCQLLGRVVNELEKMYKKNHVFDNLSLLQSEIRGSKFASANYYNLSEKCADISLSRQHLENDVRKLEKQIDRLKLVENVLNKIAQNEPTSHNNHRDTNNPDVGYNDSSEDGIGEEPRAGF